MLAMTVPAATQSKAPRTPWGKPDLQGIWDFRTITPMERPGGTASKEFLSEEEAAELENQVIKRNQELDAREAKKTTARGDGNVDRQDDGSPGFYNNFWLDQGTRSTRRTSLVIDPPDGRIPPLTAAARERGEARRKYATEHPADSWLDRSTADRCLVGFNAGPPIVPGGYNQNIQLFQTPEYVALHTEMIHTVRIVPLDGRPALTSGITQWSGDGRGRWEGDTLVVETANFSEDRRWRGASRNMKLIERFTRIDANTLEYKYTVVDPETWEKPWTVSIPMQKSDLPIYEYACHEGNYAMPNILAGERVAEKEKAAKK
jgi:hypothetical protein